MKQCRKCQKLQPITEFGLDKRSPDGRAPRCRTCRSEYDKELRKKLSQDPEWVAKRLQRDREYARRNPEKMRERSRRYRKRYPERAAAAARRSKQRKLEKDPDYFRRWARENAARHRANSRKSMRKWRQNNPDLERAAKKRYRENNGDVVRAREREKTYSRRAKMPFSRELAELMDNLVQQPCSYCGSRKNITIDHVIPLARGGKHEAKNLAPACLSCNSSKGARTLDEWPGPPSTN